MQSSNLLSPKGNLLLLLGLFIISNSQTWAQDKVPPIKSLANVLKESSIRVSEAPTPPPKYMRRLWQWQKAKERSNSQLTSQESLPVDLNPSLLSQAQAELWNALGQATEQPLYESPSSRNQREYQMDLDTEGTPILPNYTHEFMPSVTPHKRMTVWNTIKDSGELAVQIGGLTEIESIELPQLKACLKSASNESPDQNHYLSLGERQWYQAQDLDMGCLQQLCLQVGSACFMGIFSTQNWLDVTRPRGVASVSPEQSLVSLGLGSTVILSQDDAGNFYLSAPPDSSLKKLDKLALVITAPLSYFSGSWRSSLSLSELKDHPNLALPDDLQRQALHLSAQLFNLEAKHSDSFEHLIFQLSDYFRAFVPGEQVEQGGSVYERLTLSQIGVCRHRSYAFMVTARALGIPTRYVTNQVHAFVEVLDPNGRWRRVDLGGEGIAPEDLGLTQDVLNQTQQAPQTYRPDDGLPQPKPFLSSQKEQEKIQNKLQTQKTTQGEQNLTYSKLKPQDIEAKESSTSSRANGQDHPSPNKSSLTSVNHERGEELEDTESTNINPPTKETSSTSSLIKNKGNDRLDKTAPEITQALKNQAFKTQALKNNQKELEESIKARFDIASCPNAYQNRPRLSLKVQTQVLSDLNLLLHQEINQLPKPSSNLQITLRSLSNTDLHRCDLMTLKGRIKKATRKQKNLLKNSYILAALKSKIDGVVLSGWGQIDARGFYRFKAQVPIQMNPGHYQVFIYLPAQKGLAEAWSQLDLN